MCASVAQGTSTVSALSSVKQPPGSTKFENATMTAFGSALYRIGSGGENAAENGAMVNTSVPPASGPVPVNGVVPSLAWTMFASSVTVIVDPLGNSGWGAESKLGPSPRRLPKKGPYTLKTRPLLAPVGE